MHTAGRAVVLVAAGAMVAATLTGCVPNNVPGSSDAATLNVDSSADACTVSAATAPSGTVVFKVANSGTATTEFYLLGSDGLRIVGEIENIGPGTTRNLTIQAHPGDYFTVCKPGMVGEGVDRTAFTVTDSGADLAASDDTAEQVRTAAANYVAYVRDQVAQLQPATEAFLTSWLAGDDDGARSQYATARAHYERIEPIAESFGNLDPQLDFREADVAAGDEWTGWHRIEKDLWPPTNAAPTNAAPTDYTPLTDKERVYFADKLTANTQELYDLVHAKDFTVSIDSISNGAIALLDEVANGKITGEEEIFSHTDLYDFQGNLDGVRVSYEGVRNIAQAKNAALVKTIDTRLGALEKVLGQFGSLDTGFTSYTDLTAAQVKALSDSVNALGEPLSQLTAVVVQ
jgi:iron uptake system component EfeO